MPQGAKVATQHHRSPIRSDRWTRCNDRTGYIDRNNEIDEQRVVGFFEILDVVSLSARNAVSPLHFGQQSFKTGLMESALLTPPGLRSRANGRAILQHLHYFGELMNTEKVRAIFYQPHLFQGYTSFIPAAVNILERYPSSWMPCETASELPNH